MTGSRKQVYYRLPKTNKWILKQMTGSRQKVYYILPEIGRLNVKQIYSTTIPRSLKFCIFFFCVASLGVINHVMYYICFMDSHSLLCDFQCCNQALSIVPTKFTFILHKGAKWQQTVEKIKVLFFCRESPFCVTYCNKWLGVLIFFVRRRLHNKYVQSSCGWVKAKH